MEKSNYFKRGYVGYFLQSKNRDESMSIKIYNLKDFECVKETSEHELIIGVGMISRGIGLLRSKDFHFYEVPGLNKGIDKESLEKYFNKKKYLRHEIHEFLGDKND